MFGFLKRKRPNFREQLRTIGEMDDSLRFALCLELEWQYQKEMEPEQAKVLAVQVANYLTGVDLAKVYHDMAPDVQKKIDAVKDLIEPKVSEAMTNNLAIRELVIRLIMTTYLIYTCLFDKEFFDQPEMKNREKLIRKYSGDNPSEFPDSENFDKYVAFATDFIQTRQRILEQRRQ